MSESQKLALIEGAGRIVRRSIENGTGEITDYHIGLACKDGHVPFRDDKTVLTVSYTLEYPNAT